MRPTPPKKLCQNFGVYTARPFSARINILWMRFNLHEFKGRQEERTHMHPKTKWIYKTTENVATKAVAQTIIITQKRETLQEWIENLKRKEKEKNDDDFENRIPIRFGEIRADVVVRLSYTLAIDVRLQRLCNIKHEKRKKEKIHQLQMSYDNREGINKNKTKQSRLGTRRWK